MGTDSSSEQSKRHGFSLVESAIVLAVVGLVLGGIWIASAAMHENYKVNKTVDGLVFIIQNTQKIISVRDSEALGFYGLTNTLIAAGAFPKDWVQGNTVKDLFNDDIGVVNYTGPARFDLYMNGVPRSACIKIVVKVTSLAADTGTSTIVGSVAINSSSIEFSANASVSPDAAAASCVDSNYIRFIVAYSRVS